MDNAGHGVTANLMKTLGSEQVAGIDQAGHREPRCAESNCEVVKDEDAQGMVRKTSVSWRPEHVKPHQKTQSQQIEPILIISPPKCLQSWVQLDLYERIYRSTKT